MKIEYIENFIQSSGAGGQNVNKVNTAVELRFDLKNSDLSYEIKARLRVCAKTYLTKDDELIILVRESRFQEANRKIAREKLFSLIEKAKIVPKKRVKTKPTFSSTKKRLESKKKHSLKKKNRNLKDY